MQTPGLIEIDLSHNEIRSVESRALELKYLTRVQLANNDWSCDCFIKPLKTFLTSKIEYDQLLYKSGLFISDKIDFLANLAPSLINSKKITF